ncbi:hypothetical protein Acy02nite_61390 [Actinoplanes cyaneus]|uniref:Uncharacterized protein n=1 Tax=Actinoplanes cyaneus TaxID=52696 RepID=A0A919M8D4_9ACTN|nr:hypothetical protein Acy02nite_61390 [Actinoplanes cyaneus]
MAFTTVTDTSSRRRVRPIRLTAASMPAYPAPMTTILCIALPLPEVFYRETEQGSGVVRCYDSGHTKGHAKVIW